MTFAPSTEIPSLRKDLEFQARDNDTVDVRDPQLLQIYTLDADDFALAREFDGSDAETLKHKLRKKRQRVTISRIHEVAEEFDELYLLDTEEARSAEPFIDNVQPYSQIGAKRNLKVLPVADEDAHWACHGCGACCHGLAVEITPEEERRIDERLYKDILGEEDFAEWSFLNADEPKKRTLRQRDDDLACIFLAPNGLCYVHARQGMSAKPDACQLFPAMVIAVPNGPPRIGLRTNCASMYKSFEDGPPVGALAGHVFEIAARTEAHKAPRDVRWFRRMAPFERFDRVCRTVRGMFRDLGLSGATIDLVDERFLGGRVKRNRRAFGHLMLEYLVKEASGPAPVEEGAYGNQISRLRRGKDALAAMKRGKAPPRVPARVARFLQAQIDHLLYLAAPLNLPDAGYALVGEMFALEGVLHAVGENGTLKTANTAFEVFMGPLVETTEHAWPILDAIDKPYADRLREELGPDGA
jgi:Fe-S-cluster containining protein